MKKRTREFSNIRIGEKFRCFRMLWIKVSVNSAANLTTGETYHIYDDIVVTPIKLRFIVR